MIFYVAVTLALMALVWRLISIGAVHRSAVHHSLDADADTALVYPDLQALIPGIAGRTLGKDFPSPAHPWIALIIDDFGPPGSVRVVPEFLDMPIDITVSVIPGNPKTAAVADAMERAGRELFIHLPMEPATPTAMEERYMVMSGIDSAALGAILDRVTTELPQAVGLNNHMGSRVTADEGLMTLLAGELKRRGLMFVDSRTGDNSIGYEVVSAEGVPALWRDVFLDNQRDSTAIVRQMNELVALARRRGWGLGIGHACPVTAATLAAITPEIVASGIRFVTAGKLVDAVWRMQQLALVAVKGEP